MYLRNLLCALYLRSVRQSTGGDRDPLNYLSIYIYMLTCIRMHCMVGYFAHNGDPVFNLSTPHRFITYRHRIVDVCYVIKLRYS